MLELNDSFKYSIEANKNIPVVIMILNIISNLVINNLNCCNPAIKLEYIH